MFQNEIKYTIKRVNSLLDFDKPSRELPVVFVGNLEECQAYADNCEWSWHFDGEFPLGGYCKQEGYKYNYPKYVPVLIQNQPEYLVQ